MKKLGLAILFLGTTMSLLAATKTVSLDVKGWTCASCSAATRIALKKLDGVESVKTESEKGEAVVVYDDAKVTPERMIEAIARLGYKATVQNAATTPKSPRSEVNTAPPAAKSLSVPTERVSFFEVPLECGAAEGLGCGSASKPVLKALAKDARISEAKINYPGNILAVTWTEPDQSREGVEAVEAAFKARNLETSLLRGSARDSALKEYGSGRWYGAAEVDRLSEREAQVIATRLVNRAKADFQLSPEKLAALTTELSSGIAAVLSRDKGDDCARDPFADLTAIAKKYLNPQQMLALRKAAEQGVGALPGEAR